jgi:diaminopimelate decarboxylase
MSFLSPQQTHAIRAEFGTPVYVYDQKTLEASARAFLAFPNAFGLTARYAMKALPTAAILRILADAGMDIDASSGFEAHRAIRAGIAPERIQITAQELPEDLEELVRQGVLFNACSLHQLRAYGESFPGTEVSVRINPGLGSGHSNRTNTGGPWASFGIWHEKLDAVLDIGHELRLGITGMHTHIGSGGDPELWKKCARMSLEIAARMPEVTRFSLGGGFKAGRMPGDRDADIQQIGEALLPDFEAFAEKTGRRLHLEVEPGTLAVANAGVVVASVIDVVDTGAAGYRFIKVDSGMTELLRPALYGAQHPMEVVPPPGSEPRGRGEYLVVGHCCESGDILTPEPKNPEGLLERTLCDPRVGDCLVIGGTGAYCSALAGKNYNSFPEAAEVLVRNDGSTQLIRRRQSLDQMIANEVLDDTTLGS